VPRRPRNLEKRGDTWFFRVSRDGKRVRHDLGTDFSEAKRRAELLRVQYRQAKRAVRSPLLTVGEFTARWQLEYIAQRRNPAGQKQVASRLRLYITPELGHLFLGDVRPEHIRGIRARAEAAGRKPQTVVHVLSDVRCLFRYAEDVGVLLRSPFRGPLMPRVQETPPKALTPAQAGRVLAVAGKYLLPVQLSLLTGLRWGEVHRLTWHDVRPDHLLIHRTKSGRVRRVPLSSEARDLLAAAKRQRSAVHVYERRHWEARVIGNYIQRRVGFPFHFHMLRHTFASRWLELGGNLETLRLILGHSSVKVTERYARLTDSAVAAAVREVLG
jgi:integrase